MNKLRWKTLRRFYELYTSDMSLDEIERLIKRDVPGVYDFYVREMEKPDPKKHVLIRTLAFLRNIFMAFILKLTPFKAFTIISPVL